MVMIQLMNENLFSVKDIPKKNSELPCAVPAESCPRRRASALARAKPSDMGTLANCLGA